MGIAEGNGGGGSNYARSVAPSARGSVTSSERGGPPTSRISRNSEGPSTTLTAARLSAMQLASIPATGTGRARSLSHHHDNRSEAAMSTVSGYFEFIYIIKLL